MPHAPIAGPAAFAPDRSGWERLPRPGSWPAALLPGLLLIAYLLPATAAAAAGPARATRPRPAGAGLLEVPALKGPFGALTQRYLNGRYAFDPSQATLAGIHAWDDRLGNCGRESIMAEIARLTTLESELTAMKPTTMSPEVRVEYDRLLGLVQTDLLELNTVRRWERDPAFYIDRIAFGIEGLAGHRFGTPAARLKNLVAREKAISALLSSALENVSNPPRPWVELALQKAEGLLAYLKNDVPAAFADVADAALQAELREANDGAVREITSISGWLKDDVLPAANGDYTLGSDTAARLLRGRELCDATLFRLERLATDELTNLKLQAESVAKSVDPSKGALELMRIYAVDHPSGDRLNAEAAALLEPLRKFCADKALVSIAPEARCVVLATPGFLRPTLRAGFQGPGPWESASAAEFAFYLTPPDAAWDDLKQEDYLRGFGRYALPLMAMRQVFPGRMTAALAAASPGARASLAMAVPSTLEGWAYYGEQVMIDQGYGDNDPRFRLHQIRSALLETCRCLVALRLHTAGMTREQAVSFFVKEGLQDPLVAQQEALLATRGIDGVAATLGKLQIQKLATDYRRARGESFSLKSFHDALLATAGQPLRQARLVMLPGDKSPAL